MRRDDERIDYDELARLAEEHKPKMIIAGGSAYPRIIDFKRFRQIADSVGALFLVDMAHFSGLVAAGVYPNPCDYADIVTSTTHKTLRGPRAGMILSKEQYGAAIDKVVFPGMQGGPLVHVIAAKAVCFLEAMTPEFVAYQKQVVANAQALGESLQAGGLPRRLRRDRFASVTGGRFRQGRARQGSREGAGRGLHHGEQERDSVRSNPPLNPSGIRLGSPAVTTRGFRETEMREVAALIADVLHNISSEETLASVRRRVTNLAERYPLYGWKLARATA